MIIGKERVKLSFKDYISIIFNLKDKLLRKTRKRICKEAENMIQNYFEVKNMIRKYNETNILKSIFLNENQLLILNYLNKPNLEQNQQLDSSINYESDYKKILNYDKDLIEYYIENMDLNSRSDRIIFDKLKKHI